MCVRLKMNRSGCALPEQYQSSIKLNRCPLLLHYLSTNSSINYRITIEQLSNNYRTTIEKMRTLLALCPPLCRWHPLCCYLGMTWVYPPRHDYRFVVIFPSPYCRWAATAACWPTPSAIAEAYHRLYYVEQSFRILKSKIETRPIFHFNHNRVKAHISICFVALRKKALN